MQCERPSKAGKKFLSTPSARRATRVPQHSIQRVLFLSTPSARRATSVHRCSISGHIYFYPRPPRGGRPDGRAQGRLSGIISIHALREEGDFFFDRAKAVLRKISIHALREEGDSWRPSTAHSSAYFYPRPPRGGRPRGPHDPRQQAPISIHALREEGDAGASITALRQSNFYPRPPRGGRR